MRAACRNIVRVMYRSMKTPASLICRTRKAASFKLQRFSFKECQPLLSTALGLHVAFMRREHWQHSGCILGVTAAYVDHSSPCMHDSVQYCDRMAIIMLSLTCMLTDPKK